MAGSKKKKDKGKGKKDKKGKKSPAKAAGGKKERRVVEGPQCSLVTGATGFLGSYLVRNLLRAGDDVYILVRPRSIDRARKFVELMHREMPSSEGRISIVKGDITRDDVTEDAKDREFLRGEIDVVWHCAAEYDISISRRQALKSNWRGVVNMLKLAEGMKRLKRFNHVSTIAVSGDSRGVWREDMLDRKQMFTDQYARTKFLGEVEARRWSTILPVAVFRPGIIVGHSKTGYMPHINGPYYLLKILLKLEDLGVSAPMLISPSEKGARINLVPVDYVADALAAIGRQNCAQGHTYHLTDPDPITYLEFFEAVCNETGAEPPRWSLSPVWLDPILKAPVYSNVIRIAGKLADMPVQAMSYARKIDYDMTNTLEALEGAGIECPRPLDYLPLLIDYARKQLMPRQPLLPILGDRSPRVL